jgi:DNA invertase Pin-like site-specific DNA recombinase
MGQTYAYIRVSTKDQNEDRQLQALEPFGLDGDHIFLDKQSGKDFDRPKYKRLMRRLKRGDLLLIKSIDRLGRNYQEILEQWRILTKQRGVDIRVLDMPLLDTTLSKDLLGTFIADLVLQLLSFVAQNEREAIKARQAEGIAAAKKRGVRFGRPVKVDPGTFRAVYAQWLSGRMTTQQAISALSVSRSTFYRHARKTAQEDGPVPNGTLYEPVG